MLYIRVRLGLGIYGTLTKRIWNVNERFSERNPNVIRTQSDEEAKKC